MRRAFSYLEGVVANACGQDAHIEALEAKLRMAKKHRDARKDPKFARLEAASRVAGNKERNLNRRVRDVMDKCMKPQGEIEGLEEQRELLEMQSARASSDATEKHDESVEIGDEADIKDADNSTVKLGIMFWEEKQEMKAELSSHEGSDLEDETPANERKRKAEDDPIAGSSKRAGRERVADMEEDEVDDSDDGTASDRAFVVDDGGDAGGADGGADDEEGSERQEEEEDLNGDEEETEEEDEADHGEGDSGSEEEDGDNLAAKK